MRMPLVLATGMRVESGLTETHALTSGVMFPTSLVSCMALTAAISVRPRRVLAAMMPG